MAELSFMQPVRLHLRLQRGMSNRIPIRLNWIYDDETSEPLDLNGCVLRLQVWSAFGGAETVLDIASPDQIAIVDAESGDADIVVDQEATALVSWQTGQYRLLLTLADSQLICLATGEMTLENSEGGE